MSPPPGRIVDAPQIVHPIARRLVTELGAVVVGWVDQDGVPHTVRAHRWGTRPHPEVARAATIRLRQLVQPRTEGSTSR
jgi:hypothetical protein